MNYRGKKDIRVYNECPFQVNLVGQRRDYIFPPCLDGEPTMNFVDFEEIEYAHSRGKVFNIGLLVFAEEDREGMYEALGVKNWKDKVWTNDEIQDIITHPNLEKMQKVIDVKDLITFERIRGMMVRFVNEKRDVSQNVINLINARYRELNAGSVTSKIVIRPTDVEEKVSADEVADLKRQLAEMQEMMKKLASVNASIEVTEPTTETQAENEAEKVATPKRGRKATAKK
jgi:hypothetical protein